VDTAIAVMEAITGVIADDLLHPNESVSRPAQKRLFKETDFGELDEVLTSHYQNLPVLNRDPNNS
jgi:hypothetical protein